MHTYCVWEEASGRAVEGVLLAEEELNCQYPWLARLLAARDQHLAPTVTLRGLDLVTDRRRLSIWEADTPDSVGDLPAPPATRGPIWRAYYITEWYAGADVTEDTYLEADLPGEIAQGLPGLAEGEVLGEVYLFTDEWQLQVHLICLVPPQEAAATAGQRQTILYPPPSSRGRDLPLGWDRLTEEPDESDRH